MAQIRCCKREDRRFLLPEQLITSTVHISFVKSKGEHAPSNPFLMKLQDSCKVISSCQCFVKKVSFFIKRDSSTDVFLGFPVNFMKFLRTPFLKNTSGRLLLQDPWQQWILQIFQNRYFTEHVKCYFWLLGLFGPC